MTHTYYLSYSVQSVETVVQPFMNQVLPRIIISSIKVGASSPNPASHSAHFRKGQNTSRLLVNVIFFYRNLIRMFEWVAVGPGARQAELAA